MSTRITNSMIQRNVLADLNLSADALNRTRQKASSGRELTRPSDNPYATARALKLRESLQATQQHQRNASDAMGWQATAEQAMNQMTEIGARIRDLVVLGGSDTTSAEGRKAVAIEVKQLIESVKEQANTQYAGQYVFSGTATTTMPYPPGVPDAYAGDGGTIAREIGPGVSLTINQSGASVLGTGAPGDFLGVLRTIATNLDSGNAAALRSTDLTALDGRLDALMGARAQNGATTNRIESAVSRLQEFEETTLGTLSETEDADFAKTMIDLSTQQAAYQAALRSGANIVQSSLMDFLR